MRRAVGQGEGVRKHLEYTARPGCRRPHDFRTEHESFRLEVALRPIAHQRHGRGAVCNVLGGFVPSELGVIGSDVTEQALEQGERFGHALRVPRRLSVPQAGVAVGAEGVEQQRLEQVRRGPGFDIA
jgi:hypothetical protein